MSSVFFDRRHFDMSHCKKVRVGTDDSVIRSKSPRDGGIVQAGSPFWLTSALEQNRAFVNVTCNTCAFFHLSALRISMNQATIRIIVRLKNWNRNNDHFTAALCAPVTGVALSIKLRMFYSICMSKNKYQARGALLSYIEENRST